jgi:hypothetical protein
MFMHKGPKLFIKDGSSTVVMQFIKTYVYPSGFRKKLLNLLLFALDGREEVCVRK